MVRNVLRQWLAMLALLVVALATPTTALAQGTQATSDYIIGPEDILTVFVRDLPEASGDFMVRLDGKIAIPIAGEIVAAGKKVDEIRGELVDKFKKELKAPDVTINVKQMRMTRIYITGQVARPLLYDMKPGWRLTELIATAGGLVGLPERLTAVVFRQGEKNITVSMRDLFTMGKEEANIALKPGDVVNIRGDATIRVNVVGDVVRPGFYDIFEGQGAIEAIAAAGGQRETAHLSAAKVTRKGAEHRVNLYTGIIRGETDVNFKLENGDTLLVPKLDSQVSVVGVVNKPGYQMIPDGRPYTVTQAIAAAGGPGQNAKLDGIVVVRQTAEGKVEEHKLNYKDITSAKKPDFKLEDRDMVFIPQSGKPNLSQISGFGNLWFIARAIFGIG